MVEAIVEPLLEDVFQNLGDTYLHIRETESP